MNDGKARRAAQVSDMKALRDVGRRAPEHEVSRINAALENAIALRDHATPENVIAAVRKERFAATVGMGDKAVCLSVQDAGGSGSMNCRPLPEPGAAAADQAPMISVDTTETGYRVTALVSDAVKSGSVVDVQGKTVTSAVVNNVFVAETTDNPKNLTLRSAKGGTNEYPFLGE
ncbi:MAG: hypothetical protein JHC95_20855 [Solirubrobacteraceae bacterium]|nr:hypothetical protein [Solirubrobacteraceae bacterium]